MQMNANQLTKIPVEKLSDTLRFLIVENEIPLSDALKQVIDDVDAVCKKLLRDEPVPAQPVIPIGLVQAINRLLDNDGSRGCFDALEQHRAKTELELLLAAAQQNEPQNIPENIPAQPVSNPYKFLGERAKYRVIIEGFSNSRSVDFEACSQEEAEEIGRDIFHEECNYGVERLESIPAQESE